MTHELYGDSDNWELESDDQDVRGWNVVNESGQQIGTVSDMYVDTETETIDRLLLDNGSEIDVRTVSVGDGTIVLSDRDADTNWARGGTDASRTSGTGAATLDRDTDTTSGYGGADMDRNRSTDDSWRIRRHEEDLQATKERQEVGAVGVRKNVVEEKKAFDVPVEREEVDIKRRAVDRPADDASFTDDGETIRVPVTAETVQVSKQPRVVEELEITKRKKTDTKRVSDTVRREEFDIDRQGDADVNTEGRG
jgi:uncharacterized protein (TIGR02271 family)